MSPIALTNAQFGVRHVLDFVFAVRRGEVEIGRGRHDDRLGLDGAERLFKISAVLRIAGDVRVLPGPQQREKIVRVLGEKEAFPKINQEVFQRRITPRYVGRLAAERPLRKLEIKLLAIERLREAPAGVNARGRAQAAARRFLVPAVIVDRVGGQRRFHAFKEDEIVPGTACRAHERQDALDHVGKRGAPLERLRRAHRPAGHQLDLLNAEFLGDQSVLQLHLVVDGDARKARAIVGLGRVARRRRQAVAEHVRNDDEIFARIERHALADHPLVVVVLSGVPGRINNNVVFFVVQRSISLVGEFGVAQRRS